jgi:hypothetical protein
MKKKIGLNKGKPRVCLWSTKMIACGFPIGQPIDIQEIKLGNNEKTLAMIAITPTKDSPRKVSGVTNHGKKIPVIDLKTTKALDISKLGDAGDFVDVTYNKNQIIIKSL